MQKDLTDLIARYKLEDVAEPKITAGSMQGLPIMSRVLA